MPTSMDKRTIMAPLSPTCRSTIFNLLLLTCSVHSGLSMRSDKCSFFVSISDSAKIGHAICPVSRHPSTCSTVGQRDNRTMPGSGELDDVDRISYMALPRNFLHGHFFKSDVDFSRSLIDSDPLESFEASYRDNLRHGEDFEEDDYEEEDNDTDGLCSMLSNDSLRSNKRDGTRLHLDIAYHEKRYPKNVNGKDNDNVRLATPFAMRTSELQSTRDVNRESKNCKLCLAIRGGSHGGLGTEVSKRLIVSALVTLAFEWMIGHVLEFLKIDMQTHDEEHYSYLDSIKSITSEKGIGGLWDGFIPWGFIQAVFKGSVFGLVSNDGTDKYWRLTVFYQRLTNDFPGTYIGFTCVGSDGRQRDNPNTAGDVPCRRNSWWFSGLRVIPHIAS